MFNVILISHGPLSKAILESAELICGKQEHVQTLGLYVEDSVEEFRHKVAETIHASCEQGDTLVVTDIMSSSPFNATCAAMEFEDFQHITGMNLAMVITVLLDRVDTPIEEVCNTAVMCAPDSIKYVNKMLEEDVEDSEGDEFLL